MVKNNLRRLSLVLAVILGCLVIWPSGAQAATGRDTMGGITLSPFLQQITIGSGDVTKSFTLTITNHTAGLQELNLSARDFGSLNDTGGVLLEGSSSYTQKYGLTSWMSLATDTVVLQPQESRTVLVSINNRSSLQPGGHYGAVVASVNSLEDQTGNKVVVNQQILSLILVNKVGGEHYDLKLAGMTQNGNWLHLPNTVRLRFQNPGNVHVVPRGVVRLKSPGGTVIAQGIINSESAFILPESYRELYVPLTRTGTALPLPGLYHVAVEYRYDGINRTTTKSFALRFVDLGLYLLALVVILAAAWQIRRRFKATNKPTQKPAPKK